MALVATRRQVFLLLLRQTAVLLAVGIAAADVGAFFAARGAELPR